VEDSGGGDILAAGAPRYAGGAWGRAHCTRAAALVSCRLQALDVRMNELRRIRR
jgi:hypothetical protein